MKGKKPMKVFRLCREEEIKQILKNQSCEKVGSYCSNSEKNSHNYNEDVKYLHFFVISYKRNFYLEIQGKNQGKNRKFSHNFYLFL